MTREKAGRATHAKLSRGELRARASAGDARAIEQLGRARERDRQRWQRRKQQRRSDPVLEQAELARQRETMRLFRQRVAERMAADPTYANTVRSTRRERDRARYQMKRDELNRQGRERYLRDRERHLEAMRAYYVSNKGALLPRHRAWHHAHRDEQNARRREAARREYRKDPEKVRGYMRAWRQANLERARLYVRLSTGKRRAAMRDGHVAARDWLRVLEEFHHRCAYCGASGPLEVDHRIPLVRGGAHTVDNIVPACRSCNSMKRARTDPEFREYLAQNGKPPGRLAEDDPHARSLRNSELRRRARHLPSSS